MSAVTANVEVMELRAVVVTDKPGHLLEMLRFEFDKRLSRTRMGLLPPGHQRLTKEAANRFAAGLTAGIRGDH